MAAVDVSSRPSTADARVFTIKAATLKFETREDILPYLKPLIDTPDVEEVHLSGNTYGVEACKFLAEILATKKNLKVCPPVLWQRFVMCARRLLSSRISFPLAFARRFRSLSPTFSRLS